jgi:hypothetical protein
MNNDQYLSLSAELSFLEELLSEIPEENVIERLGFQNRLLEVKYELDSLNPYHLINKAKLTFQGLPVDGSRAIAASFAAKVTGAFADAIAAISAGWSKHLNYHGPLPDRGSNELFITGVAVGSFGFEFEVPRPDSADLFPEASKVEDALSKTIHLLDLSVNGSDEELSDLIEDLHPRAVRKVYDFLNVNQNYNAFLGLEFKSDFFKFRSEEELQKSIFRLRDENINEVISEFDGEFQGVLPKGRTFEFKAILDEFVIRGKIGHEIQDPDFINREFLHKKVKVKMYVLRVGSSRPKYSIVSLKDIFLK